ncbi:MAG: PAS domain S-box protein, partial [Candidatus Contendobacter sp.]|nr:PAS domain S-box protein [Candidatus Contendobacter sp.]
VAIRQREQDLATSEARYRSVIANAPVVIFQFDEHGVFTLSEGKGLARIGLAAGEVVGRSVFELYRDHPEICEYARRAIGGEAFQCVSRTGDIFFEISYNAVRDRDGHINVTGIAMDITERQQAQEALQESDARLRAAIESVPFDFFLIGANGRYVLQNSASKAHWGNVVGLSPEDVTNHAATLAHWRSNNRKALAGQIVEEEVRATVGDEERYTYNIIAPIKDRDEVRGIVGLNIDITERKRAALALRQSEAKYQRLHESMMDAFVSIDMVGKIQEFNHVYQAMLGYSEDELRTLTYVDLTPEQWRARDMKILEDQILAQGYSEVYEKEYRRKDGTFFPVELRKFLLRDSTNQPIGMWAIVRDITERKRAEEALRQSRNLLQTVLDTIPACVFWKDHDLRYLGCNQAFARDAGANSTSELIGRDDYQLAWREQADLYRSDDRQVLESGTPKIDYEEPQTTPDGRRVWLRISKVALRDADGVVFGILGTYQDITEHKQAEEAIQRTNRQLRMLSDCNQALIRITDEIELLTTVCTITVQEGGYRMAWVGYAKRDELKTVRPIAHAGFEESYLRSANITWADDERGRGPIGTAIRTGHPCVVQNIAQDPRMSSRRAEAIKHGYAAVCALPLQIGDRIFGALSIYSSAPNAFDTEEIKFLSELASDLAFGITVLRTQLERERAEIALRESERKYRELVENANSIILRWSPHGEITFMNEFGLKLFGFSKEELMGQHVVGTIVPLDESTGRNLRPLMEDICLYPERFMHNTNENTRRDGARLWIDWTNKAVLDEHGQIIEIFSVGSDITDRKWAEEELERHREHLEELVAERTAELRQAMTQLVQSEKLAALGNLVAGVAHELNTPLGNARMVATALGEHLREFAAAVASGALRRSQVERFLGRSREAVDLLERNTARAADLISQFKEVAVDQTSVRRRRFDLRQTVEELLAALRPQLKHTAHRVDLDIPPAIELDSYPGPLEQVVTNLITNSLTHGFAGIEAGTIRIRAAPLDPDRVQIDYADDGVGIPEGTINRIFEPFFTTRLGSGGSGLGLYIVYNLVTGVLGGTIRSHSSVGQGVHFTLVLKATAPS